MKKHSICFLLNSLDDFNFQGGINKFFPKNLFQILVTDRFPENPEDFKLIVPWSYQKKIAEVEKYNNVIVIHSSDLPNGKGWAPIYNHFNEQRSQYVISIIIASDKIDSGDIIMRIKFKIENDYTASFIRRVDEELSLFSILKIIQTWPNEAPVGIKQGEGETFYPRRWPSDNEVNLKKSLLELVPHLRGVEKKAPAFFIYKGIKYIIEIKPELEPSFPKEIVLDYPGINKLEVISDYANTP